MKSTPGSLVLESQSAQDGESGWLDGGEGDDQLVGDAGADILLGGAGGDLILGGGGDDQIAGDDEGREVSHDMHGEAYQVWHEVVPQDDGTTLYRYEYSAVNEVAHREGGDDALFRESQSLRHGDPEAAHDNEWRKAA